MAGHMSLNNGKVLNMNMKKEIKCIMILLVFCISLLYCPHSLAASPKVYLTKKTDGGETVIPSAEEGLLTVHAEVEKKAVLIAALKNKTTGYIKEIAAAASEGAGHIRAEIRVYDLQDNALTYYIWDSLADRKPQQSAPPAMPKNIRAEAKVNALELFWSAGAAAENVAEYRIYDGDTLLQTVQNDLHCTIRGLEENTAYKYAISAVNAEGAESQKAEVCANTKKMLQYRFDAEEKEDGLGFVDNATNMGSDSYTTEAVIEGVNCRAAGPIPYNNTTRQGMLYFKVDLNKLPTEQKYVTFRIQYYDIGNGTIQLQYNAESSIAKGVTVARLTDSKTWKTAVVSVDDAKFTNPAALQYAGFRIGISAGETLYARNVAVIGSDLYDTGTDEPEQPDEPQQNSVSADFGTLTFNGLNLWLPPVGATSDGVTTAAQTGGEDCRYAAKGKWFYLSVDPTVIPSDQSKVKISLRYYDDNAGSMILQYNSGDTGVAEGIPRDYKSKTVLQKTGSNTWKDVSFTLDDASFRQAQGSYKADMRIGTQTEGDGLYIQNVTIEKIQ